MQREVIKNEPFLLEHIDLKFLSENMPDDLLLLDLLEVLKLVAELIHKRGEKLLLVVEEE